jgi:hypothetical protein
MKSNEWIIYGEVGVSSKTIWAVMTGVVTDKQRCDRYYDTPKDPDDFKRCWKLIGLFPEWKLRLNEVAKVFPKWIPYIREWDKLDTMIRQWFIDIEEYEKFRRKYPRKEFNGFHGMYEFMQELDHEAMILDGWIEEGKGSWHRDEEQVED